VSFGGTSGPLDKLAWPLARGIVRRIHERTTSSTRLGSLPDVLAGAAPACAANQCLWGGLPERLIEQIDGLILMAAGPVRRPHLIHADLTGDHLLGRLDNGRWTTWA
jgi:hypothetical protein